MIPRSYLLINLCLITFTASAQTWSIPSKSAEIAFRSIVYLESVYPKPGATKGLTDTLTGTGILLKDGDRVYLVTTKHSVQLELTGKNQQLLNTSITFTTAAVNSNKVKYVKLPILTANSGNQPYLLSPDNEDIAVISFQKKEFKPVLAALLKDEGKPLPVKSLDQSDDHYPDENYFHPSYMVYKSKTGLRGWSKGLGTAKIKTYPDTSAIFTVTDYISAGRDGSPLFINDKIIGIIKNGEELGPNDQTVRDPFKKANSALVIKATRILPLIKKMQEMEQRVGY